MSPQRNDRFWRRLKRWCILALWTHQPQKFENFENPRWWRPPFWKLQKSLYFRNEFRQPVLTKFGMLIHFGPLDPITQFLISPRSIDQFWAHLSWWCLLALWIRSANNMFIIFKMQYHKTFLPTLMKFVILIHIGLSNTTGQKHSNCTVKMQDCKRPSFWKIEKAQYIHNRLADSDKFRIVIHLNCRWSFPIGHPLTTCPYLAPLPRY